MKQIPIPFFALMLAISACGDRKTGDLVPDETPAYLPLEIGRCVTYAVDSIIYDSDGQGGIKTDTNRFFAKEILTDTFRDAAGNLAFRLERFERPDELHDWLIHDVWAVQRVDHQSVRTEENLRYIKLVHPLDRRSEWDGLAFIDREQVIEIAGEPMDLFKGWLTEVDTVDKPRAVGNFSFDSTLVLREADYDDKVDRRFSKEIYAKNVGLVFREQWLLHSRCADKGDLAPCAGKPWEDIAGKGFILRQVVVDFQ